jgi:serine/threonine protein kinase
MTGSAPLGPGETLAGKYRIERVLGSGGMGVVVEATHLQLHTRVAIKFLRPSAHCPAAAERFIREARATSKIISDHVVRVIDAGTFDSNCPYIVMDLLEGETLAQALRTKKRLPIEDAVTHMLQACRGLAMAHAVGVVHRDVKPSNIFLARGPRGTTVVKVLDFGLAKVLHGEDGPRPQAGPLTRTADVFGSPFYMSPEQLRCSRDVDARTDIWAVGVMLFELLTGHRPFNERSLHSLCESIARGRPRRVRQFRPDVPIELAAIVERCLAKHPDKRFRTVRDLASALAPFASPMVRTIPPPSQRKMIWFAFGLATGVFAAVAMAYCPSAAHGHPAIMRGTGVEARAWLVANDQGPRHR